MDKHPVSHIDNMLHEDRSSIARLTTRHQNSGQAKIHVSRATHLGQISVSEKTYPFGRVVQQRVLDDTLVVPDFGRTTAS